MLDTHKILGGARMNYNHYWSECPQCGPMVVCGKCGNNCCNAGYGTLEDGSDCDACPSAYEMQDTPKC